ncbi:MAG: O-antigen ligase family protein [Vicinamibacterales bacterium]
MNPRLVLAPVALPGLVAAAVLVGAWTMLPAPAALRVVPLALAVLALARPAAGLLAFAAAAPLAPAIAALAGAPSRGGAFLEQLVLAVVVGAGVQAWRRRDAPSRLAVAAAVLGALGVASAIAVQPMLVVPAEPAVSWTAHARALLAGAYFDRGPAWAPLHAAALLAEGLALAVTVERAVAARPGLARRLVLLATVATAAVAVLNLARVAEAAARGDDFLRTFGSLFYSLRVSRFYDVNAAGSIFVLATFAAVGLWRSAVAPRAWGLALLVVLGAGLWLSGSRTALATLALVIVLLLAHRAVRGHPRRRRAALGMLGTAVAAIVIVVAAYPSTRNFNTGGALRTRVIMARVAMNMWASAPVLGIGIGRFLPESSNFGGEALQQELGFITANENAHNYFLQVLATLGLAGFVMLIAVLAGPLAAAWRRGPPARANGAPDADAVLHWWLLVGLAAYLITWLTGHPQLVPDAAITFWLLFGALAGPTRVTARPAVATVAGLAAMALLLTAPVRATGTRHGLDLEHIGVGVSGWRDDAAGGPSYREAGRTFGLYVPANGLGVSLPLRRAPGAPDPLRLSLARGGDILQTVTLTGDDWQAVTIALEPRGARFDLVTFTADDGNGAAPGADVGGVLVHVGRYRPR